MTCFWARRRLKRLRCLRQSFSQIHKEGEAAQGRAETIETSYDDDAEETIISTTTTTLLMTVS